VSGDGLPQHETGPDDTGLRALIDAAQGGSSSAQAALFRRTVPYIFRLVSRFLRHSADVDDLVQQVYLNGFKAIGTYRGEAAFTTWLGRIAVRAVFKHLRKERRRWLFERERLGPGELQLVATDSEAGQEQRLHERRCLDEALHVLHRLSPKLRIPFMLHHFDGHDVATVASLTESTVQATYKNLLRARERFEALARKRPLLHAYVMPATGGAP
jgi:RNA polymerase sigma-70 factor (ECF subfamily)